uniref:DUF676 domain-containing protein n=1 Tax=Oryza meridionalis TaxID=40149 RepID=A0A0E0D602_9ORYZ
MAEGEGEGGEKKSQRRRLRAACLPRPGCFTVSAADEGPSGSGGGGGGGGGSRPAPTHLVVTVNGIVGSAENWRYAAKHFIKKHPEDVVVHCSGCNGAARTFDGVDVMGTRLAEERRPELQKISFVAHSLGGLIARYAIALLYKSATEIDSHEEHEKQVTDVSSNQLIDRGKIAGLEPINFITFATPHLGTRSHKQIPLLRGSYKLEKMAYRISWIAGRSGKHLFLKDIEDGKPPLLLQMVTDYGRLCVLSSVVLLTQTSVTIPQNFINHVKYPHVVYVEKPKVQDTDFSDSMIYQAKNTSEMEELMLKGLNRIPWERVDVSFKKSRQRIFAHSTIQVKTYFFNSDGADCMAHQIGNLLEIYWGKEATTPTKMLCYLPDYSRFVHSLELAMEFLLLCSSSLLLLLLSSHGLQSTEGGELHHHQIKEPPPEVEQTGGKGWAAMSETLIGSRPPRCEGKCAPCGRCEAVQVPVAPRAGRLRAFFFRADDDDESSTNYKPLNWKCRDSENDSEAIASAPLLKFSTKNACVTNSTGTRFSNGHCIQLGCYHMQINLCLPPWVQENDSPESPLNTLPKRGHPRTTV